MIAWLTKSLASLALAPGALAGTMAVVFGASVLRGFTGFGFAIAAVPLLGLLMSPTQAVALALGLQLLGGLTDFPRASRHCHWPSLKWLVAGATIGSPAGILLLSIAPASVGRVTIGTITLIAAIVLGRGVTLAAFPGSAATLAAGLTAGLFNGLAAMPGPPAVAYYLAAPVQRIAARASLLVFFLATSVPALASAAFIGLIDAGSMVLSVVSLPVMVVGTIAGEKAGTRGSDRLHRALSIALLVAIAMTSIGKGAIELIEGRG